MFDRDDVVIAGAVAAAIPVVIGILSGLYTLFVSDVSEVGAIVIAAMGLVLFAVLLLAVANRFKIKKIGGEEA